MNHILNYSQSVFYFKARHSEYLISEPWTLYIQLTTTTFFHAAMNNFKESSSTPNNVNGEEKHPGHSLPTGKPHSHKKAKRNNIMLEKFQNFQPNVKPSRDQYAYIPKPLFFYGSLTALLQIHYNSKKLLGSKHPQFLHQPE